MMMRNWSRARALGLLVAVALVTGALAAPAGAATTGKTVPVLPFLPALTRAARTPSGPPNNRFCYINVGKGKLVFDKNTRKPELVFALTLSRVAHHEVDVTIETKGGTAKAGAGYLNENAKISFKPGQTSYNVYVPVELSGQNRYSSFFYLKTVNPVGCQLGNGEGAGVVPTYMTGM